MSEVYIFYIARKVIVQAIWLFLYYCYNSIPSGHVIFICLFFRKGLVKHTLDPIKR